MENLSRPIIFTFFSDWKHQKQPGHMSEWFIMKYLFVFFVIAGTSCGSTDNSQPGKAIVDTTIQGKHQEAPVDKDNIPVFRNSSFDSTINRIIILGNPESVERNLGNDFQLNEWDTAHSDVYFSSIDKSSYLKMVHHPGDPKNYFSLFEVGLVNTLRNTTPLYQSKIYEFETESGIKLGLSMAGVKKKIKSGKYKASKEMGFSSLVYSSDEGGLRFEAAYYFKNDKLVKFDFGYLNP